MGKTKELSQDMRDKIVDLHNAGMGYNGYIAWNSRPRAIGEVGDWVNHFTPAQSQVFDEDYERQMKNAGVPFRTTI